MRFLFAFLVAVALVMSGPAMAGKKNKNKGQGQGQGVGQNQNHGKGDSGRPVSDNTAGGLITAVEEALIKDYFGGRDLPPSLAANKSLPPGIQKKIARGGTMPPGIAKRFPSDLRGQLPHRAGYDWLVSGSDAVLVDATSRVIVDVLRGIF